MKTAKIIFLLVITGMLFSCQKDEKVELRDVSFGISQMNPILERTELVPVHDYIICPTDDEGNLLVPTVAHIIIDGVDYYPEVFYIGDKLYTQSIKLVPGDYTVTKFVLLTEEGGEMIMAVPGEGSTFDKYVTTTTPFDITVTAFEKTEIDVEVLCFSPKYYGEFGFNWFDITEIVVREICFFGDICAEDLELYTGSAYEGVEGGIQVDMPAIMTVHVGRPGPGGVLWEEFSNLVGNVYYTNEPLCVTYPDRLGVPEQFKFRLELWVWDPNHPAGPRWVWRPFDQYIVNDDGPLSYPTPLPQGTPIADIDGDEVYDFVWGDCNYDPADIQFLNMPYPK